jgi:hypothetical protein
MKKTLILNRKKDDECPSESSRRLHARRSSDARIEALVWKLDHPKPIKNCLNCSKSFRAGFRVWEQAGYCSKECYLAKEKLVLLEAMRNRACRGRARKIEGKRGF